MNHSKIYIRTMIVGLLALSTALIAGHASAATISPSVSSVEVRAGDTVTVRYSVNPMSIPNYTVKLDLLFPPALLRAVSFGFADGWIALPEPGYDLIDNSKGEMIKTGGVPKGITTATLMGTATFKVLKQGEGAITIASGSFVLNSANANVLQGPNGETIISVSSTPAPQAKVEAPAPAVQASDTPPVIFDVGVTPSVPSTSRNPLWFVLLFFIILILYFLWFAYRRRRLKEEIEKTKQRRKHLN